MTDFEDEDRLTKVAKVSEYLRNNPQFFADNPSLLVDLSIPHRTGADISLVELQISTLRKENKKLKEEITNIVQIARENDALSSKLHSLFLNLIESSCSRELLTSLNKALLTDFGADHARTLLFSRMGDESGGETSDEDSGKVSCSRALFEKVIKKGTPECGVLDSSLVTGIFGKEAVVRSGVMLPLVGGAWDGVVVIGSKRADRYNKEMGTEFLIRMRDLLVILLESHRCKVEYGTS